MDSLYEWLVRSTLGLILPISVALFVLFLTRGNSAASRSAIALGVSLLLLLAPALQSILPTIHWMIPALENLNAFSGEWSARWTPGFGF